MASLKLDILAIPTYSVLTIGVADISTYPTDPPSVSSPTIEITPPGFPKVVLPFVVEDFNVYNSSTLNISNIGQDLQPLPDGVYFIKYSVAPAYENFVEHSIMRVDRIQEKFDIAIMYLDMMECDRAVKTQSTVTLNSINFLIQGSIAAANNCAIIEANKLYEQANNMLNNMIRSNCGCDGNNYMINFVY
jgi:hypothetical protein